ncbi:MAG: AAA family ATPase [Alphaproteobacteria bacterium]|nr:AAA family ATPase [Alphaproteobacteria bacterium]
MTCLVALGGHVGTGKTTLAYGLRRTVGILKNAVVMDDDQVRREVLGVDLKYVFCDDDYTEAISARITGEIERRTVEALSRDIPVINASGFFTETARQAVQKLAEGLHKNFIGIWLIAPRHVMKERIVQRVLERQSLSQLVLERGHASDADEGVIGKFEDLGLPASPAWIVMDASISAQDLLAAVCETRFFCDKSQVIYG